MYSPAKLKPMADIYHPALTAVILCICSVSHNGVLLPRETKRDDLPIYRSYTQTRCTRPLNQWTNERCNVATNSQTGVGSNGGRYTNGVIENANDKGKVQIIHHIVTIDEGSK